jgi:dihydroneopterin aldolase
LHSTIELNDLVINTDIGTYEPGDVVPSAHLLDLTLSVDPSLVLIDTGGMENVFDYDPLITEIDRLARDGHYETQERLITRVVTACAAQAEITSVDICLRKTPVIGETGTLGVRLVVDAEDLTAMRERTAS